MNHISQEFVSLISDVKKYCQESVQELLHVLSGRNRAIFDDIVKNANQTNDAIIQKIQEAATVQKDIDMFHTTLNCIEHLLDDSNTCSDLINKNPAVLENMLWLLSQFKCSEFFSRVQVSLQKIYGSEALDSLMKFKKIKTEHLKEGFTLKFTPVFAREYVYQLYIQYNQQVDLTVQLETEQEEQNKAIASDDPEDDQQDLVNKKLTVDLAENTNAQEEMEKPLILEEGDQEKTQQDRVESNEIKQEKVWENLKITSIKGVNKDNVKLYNKIVSALKATKTIFTDSDFPPQLSCITSDPSQIPPNKKIVWKRIPDLYPNKKLTLCSDEIGPEDVVQGKLRNCYFLSALSVLAEQKHLIRRLFESKKVTETGCYSIWLCDSGEWKNIIIDDYIPCTVIRKGQLKPYFSQLKGNDIWVLLLEKAYAKLYGHYFSLHSGYLAEAYYALTGASVNSFMQKNNRIRSIEHFWTFLTTNIQQKFVITASCREDEPSVNNAGMGLVSKHAYGILDAKEVRLPEGKTERLVKLRNPWGFREWRGKWGDRSPCWTPELMEYLNYKPHDKDGVFWMSVEDVDKHFHQSYACQINSEHTYSFVKLGEKVKNQNVFIATMRLNSPGLVYLSIQQKAKRHFRNSEGYEYSFMRVILAKVKNDQVSAVVECKYKSHQNIVIQHDLVPGRYLVLIDVDWAQNIYHKVNLTAYSSVKVTFTEEPPEKYDIPMLYPKLIRKLISVRKPKLFKGKQYENEGNKMQIWRYELRKSGLGAILYVNREKNIEFHCSLDVKNSKNMMLMSPSEEQVLDDICVPSGEERMIILRAKQFNHNFEYKEDFRFVKRSNESELNDMCQQKEVINVLPAEGEAVLDIKTSDSFNEKAL